MKPRLGRYGLCHNSGWHCKKTVTVKTTGHEKTRVSNGLAAKADGTKLPPFIVFKGAKQETAALDKEIKTCCIASSPNAWMNTELTYSWVNKVFGTWDLYECHREDSVNFASCKKTFVLIVLERFTKYIQDPDVSWNKPFNALETEKYDQ